MSEIDHQGGKRKFESIVKEGDEVDSHNNAIEEDDDYIPYDVVTYAGGRKMSPENRKEYIRQIDESNGFDITLDLKLGAALGGPIVPLRGEEDDPEIIELSRLAIDKYNSQNAQNYVFVKIVTVNASTAAGIWYYITFDAKDANNAAKTFQARVWSGWDGETEVAYCRLKNSSCHEGDKISPDSDVGTG